MAQKNLEAKKCGGIIHSDIEDNFIQLEVYNYDDLKIINENPKLIKTRREGSCYIIKEGDICNFLFGKKKK
jgi:ribosome-binding ATPase YchF (GTP1/OBG family)